MASRTETSDRDAWDAIADRYDLYVTPLHIQVGERLLDLAVVRPGLRLLDVAAGSGAVALPAAARGAAVVAADLAPAMVRRLEVRARTWGLSNVTTLVMDGTALALPNDRFDVAVSLNGVSLFPDLGGGLRQMVRVTKPGGTVVVAAFHAPRRVELFEYVRGALQATIPELTPPAEPSPPMLQATGPAPLHRALAAVGLSHVAVEPLTWRVRVGSGAHLWNVVTSSSPSWAALAQRLTAAQTDAVRQVLDGMLRERSGGPPGAVLDGEMNVGTGTRPSGETVAPDASRRRSEHGHTHATWRYPMNQQVSYRHYSGTAAENYERYFVPTIAAPVAADLLRAAALLPGERVLDVACGTGVIARLAAEQVGARGTVAGIDAAPDMIEVARSTPTSSGAVIDWREGDAASLPVADGSFDVVLCQMGLMLFPDKPAALAEIRRVLVDGGRVALNTPGTINRPMEILAEGLARHINPNLAGFVRAVFSMDDPAVHVRLLRDAGFNAVEAKVVTTTLHLPPPREFLWQYINLTPMGAIVSQTPDAAQAALEDEVVRQWQATAEGRAGAVDQPMVIATGRA